jgi:hypothetical protein
MYNSVMYNANKSTAGTDRVKHAMALGNGFGIRQHGFIGRVAGDGAG